MITSDLKKKMTDSWFSYLQSQICKEFEYLEDNKIKFTKRDWTKNKKNEGGGTAYLLSRGKLFDKVRGVCCCSHEKSKDACNTF